MSLAITNPPAASHAIPLVAALDRKKRAPILSVIIPALNEEGLIGKCLGALAEQTLSTDEFEVVVVDNGSSDRTVDIALQFGSLLRISVLHQAGCNISAARNAAVASARGTFLAFLDADCIPSPEWLTEALRFLQRGDGGVIGAFYTVPGGSGWVADTWYGDLAATRHGEVSYVPSGTMFVSRSVFSSLGGFDPRMQTSEDFEFCQRVKRAGYEVLGQPELSTVHLGTPRTLAAFYRKQRWHGNGVRTILERNALDAAFAKTILQTFYVFFLLTLSVVAMPISLLTRRFMPLGLPVGFLLLGILAMALRGARQRKRWSLIVPLTFLYFVYGIARSLSLLGVNRRRVSPNGKHS